MNHQNFTMYVTMWWCNLSNSEIIFRIKSIPTNIILKAYLKWVFELGALNQLQKINLRKPRTIAQKVEQICQRWRLENKFSWKDLQEKVKFVEEKR